jgi:hypothetical protein
VAPELDQLACVDAAVLSLEQAEHTNSTQTKVPIRFRSKAMISLRRPVLRNATALRLQRAVTLRLGLERVKNLNQPRATPGEQSHMTRRWRSSLLIGLRLHDPWSRGGARAESFGLNDYC